METVTLVRTPPVEQTFEKYEATAHFLNGDTEHYTYSEKETDQSTITLYEYNTDNITAGRTAFRKQTITHNEIRYREKVPEMPVLRKPQLQEKTTISLPSLKEFTITDTYNFTITYDDWRAGVDIPKDAAQAYQAHFGDEHCKIRD